MAIDLTLKSVAITNREALTPVANNPGRGGEGIIKEVFSYLASMVASLSITSIIRMVQVPSNAIVSSIRIMSGAQTAGMFNVGVYRTLTDGGAVVDVDLFGSAIDLGAAVVDSEISNESAQYTILKRNMPLWEAAGLASDPGGHLDIALTCVTEAVTTGLQPVGLVAAFVQ